MSMAVRHIPWISPEEYLDQEQVSSTRHMYCAGVVTARAGGSLAHGMLAMNLGAELRAALRGRGCRVVGSDVLFRTGSMKAFWRNRARPGFPREDPKLVPAIVRQDHGTLADRTGRSRSNRFTPSRPPACRCRHRLLGHGRLHALYRRNQQPIAFHGPRRF